MQTHSSQVQRRCWWPLLIAVPPLAAVLGCIATIYFSARQPDREMQVIDTTTLNDAERRHVSNSVVPPLR